jgi:type VI secretion system secreted protein VgrG
MTLSVLKRQPGARRFRSRATAATALFALFALGMLLTISGGATAAATPISLGTADSFAILSGTPDITDVPTSAITGDVGLSPAPGSGIGLGCSEVTGTIYSVDTSGPLCRVTDPSLLTTAKNDLTTAFGVAAAEPPDTTYAAGQLPAALGPGVYKFGHDASGNVIGNLTLNGSASSIWVFQATSDLITATGSSVTLTGGALACNVFWEVDSSASLGSGSSFTGTIMALTSITLATGASVNGRVLAQNGDVTLEQNTITESSCAAPPTTTSGTATSGGTGGTATTGTATSAGTPTTPAAATATTARPVAVITSFATAQAAAALKAAAQAKAAAAAAVAAAKKANLTAAAAAARKAAVAAATAQAAANTAATVALTTKATAAKAAAVRAASAAKAAKLAAIQAKAAVKAAAVKAASAHVEAAHAHAGFTG